MRHELTGRSWLGRHPRSFDDGSAYAWRGLVGGAFHGLISKRTRVACDRNLSLARRLNMFETVKAIGLLVKIGLEILNL